MEYLKNTYLAFVLSPASRERLLTIFKPKFSKVICHHVTIDFNLTEDRLKKFKHLLDEAPGVLVKGYACGDGIECISVKVGSNSIREDGSFYHITLSLEPPHKPVESNKLFDLITPFSRNLLLDGSFQLLTK
jgi:hypothetical protein